MSNYSVLINRVYPTRRSLCTWWEVPEQKWLRVSYTSQILMMFPLESTQPVGKQVAEVSSGCWGSHQTLRWHLTRGFPISSPMSVLIFNPPLLVTDAQLWLKWLLHEVIVTITLVQKICLEFAALLKLRLWQCLCWILPGHKNVQDGAGGLEM